MAAPCDKALREEIPCKEGIGATGDGHFLTTVYLDKVTVYRSKCILVLTVAIGMENRMAMKRAEMERVR